LRGKARKLRRAYTRGELNRLLDSILHPLAKEHSDLLVLDGILHAIIEQNPSESAAKFIQHNLPKLLNRIMRGPRGGD